MRIEAKSLFKQYPGSSDFVLKGVDLTIPHGCVFGLLGPNGAGKTTLVSVLTGLVAPTRGSVTFDGKVFDKRSSFLKQDIGLVPQECAFYSNLTGDENLTFFLGVQGVDKSKRREHRDFAVEVTGLSHFLNKPVQSYSGGMKRRLNFAIGLLNRPRVLFLDEPTVGVDPNARKDLIGAIAYLKTQGTTVVYCSHYLEEMQQLCDYVAFMNAGTIILTDRIDKVLQSNELTIEFDLPIDDRMTLPGRMDADQRRCVVTTNTPLEVLVHIDRVAKEHGRKIVKFTYDHQSLEHVFLNNFKVDP